MFRTMVDKNGLEGIRFHDCRHAHATILLRNGVPPHVVQNRLGHSDVAITLRVYSHVLPQQERDAVDTFAAGIERAVAAQRG
ncbi:MAG: tyrosine-type recombinase/integrase [Coriobacteriia bacterium]|nr:tyrosine-type recombinase/integrase [Coriobacteriia bacterium]